MSKKHITLKYQTPLEFIATYAKKGYEGEKEVLEEVIGKTLIELIAMVQENESEYWNLQTKIEDFANGCGMVYCYDHEIYHEYENCPFCSLGIKKD
jgi:hypothetical protein